VTGPDPRSTVTLCGHPESVNGHCAFEGDPVRKIAPCGNRWQLCAWPQCQASAQVPLCVPGNDCIGDAGAQTHQGVG